MRLAPVHVLVSIGLLGCSAAGPTTGPSDAPAPRAARSVHLRYQGPTTPAASAVYREVVVEKSTAGSYFMACGFTGGYFGIQEQAGGRKVALFSVWDTAKGDDAKATPADQRVEVLGAGKDVTVKRFGGEGTGAQSFLDFDWHAGQPVQFYLQAWPTAGGTTTFAAYIRDPAGKLGWQHMATFRRRDVTGAIQGQYSFIEDFRRDTVSAGEVRRARFVNTWVRGVEGTWAPAASARFTASGATWEARESIDAGPVEGGFYLQTGGDTKMSRPLRSEFPLG